MITSSPLIKKVHMFIGMEFLASNRSDAARHHLPPDAPTQKLLASITDTSADLRPSMQHGAESRFIKETDLITEVVLDVASGRLAEVAR
jgi:hypothetical protein